MNQYSIDISFVKLPEIDVDLPAFTTPAECNRCEGPLGDITRRHCFPCILTALVRWPSMGVSHV